MSFLMMSIDSTSYTTMYHDVVENIDDAVATLIKREANDGEGLTVATSTDGVKTRITLSDGNIYDEYFVVAEVIPMPQKRYAVAWWHAYDGVGFDLKGASDNSEEAAEALDFYVRNYVEDENIPVDYEKGDLFVSCDTGNEWEMLEVIDLKAA